MMVENKYLVTTNKQDFWLSQTYHFFVKRLLCPPLITCINGTCLNLRVRIQLNVTEESIDSNCVFLQSSVILSLHNTART